jgi:signal transduction histidine kinase
MKLARRYDPMDSVVCYASELRQVFTNFIANAFDATRLEGTLTLATRRRRHARTRQEGVAILIADTGHGMTAEVLRHLFEPFYTTKGMNGTGLGVWVSKSVLDKHHSIVRVRSCAAAGKTATMWHIGCREPWNRSNSRPRRSERY